MIKYLQIENFKSLKKIGIPLENLNLFFGMNGMGKSSVIQTLLMLRQSFWKNQMKHMELLHVNGDLIELGTGREIMCQTREEDELRICVVLSNGETLDRKYIPSDYESKKGTLQATTPNSILSEGIVAANVFSSGFVYLGAEHIRPQRLYQTTTWEPDINIFGKIGEFAVPYLAINGNRYHVPAEKCLDTGKTDTLIDQVSAWLNEISPQIRISTDYSEFDGNARLEIGYDGTRLSSAGFAPVNVGYGVPYVIPLIVSLLTATDDALLLIENPESHLHPRGQSRIGELIARTANHGAQVICESHSDHIINGVRLSIKNNKISDKDVTIKYFVKNEAQETEVIDIETDKNGNLSSYPQGLLDEWGIIMSELMR